MTTGTCADCQALREDPEKMAALESEPEVGKIVLGDDIHAFNELMKSVYEAIIPPPTPPPPPHPVGVVFI